MASLKNALDRALKTVTRSPPAPDEELHDQAQPAEPADGSLRISELEAEIVRLKEMLFTAAQTSTATATDPDRFRGGDAKGRSEDEGGMGPLGSPIVMVSQRQRTRRQIEQPEGRKKRRLMSVSSEERMDRGASGLDGKDQFAIT